MPVARAPASACLTVSGAARPAPGLNGAGADEHAEEVLVAHARGVVLQVAEGFVPLLDFDPGQGEGAGGGGDGIGVARRSWCVRAARTWVTRPESGGLTGHSTHG